MDSFVFQNQTKIIFGKGKESEVGAETKAYAQKVLLHYGEGSIKKTGLYDRVIRSLEEAGVERVELSGVQPNPRLSLVQEGIDLCRRGNIGFILAVGGGSAIDSAKAIAAGVKYDGDVWDLFKKEKEVLDALPVGVILTIPAAGSEASGASVVTKEEGNYKLDIGADLLRPKFSILNPELTLSLSKEQTMTGITDMTAHITERYFTQVSHVDLTDRLIEGTYKTIMHNAGLLLEDLNNLEARSEIMWAGTVAHNDWLSTGREGDWGSHMIEHELSGIYDIPHGVGLSIVIPAWMKYVYKENIPRFIQLGRRVFDIEESFGTPEETALEAIQRFKGFYKSLGLPVSLAEVDIPDDRFEEMAEKCVERGPVGNFKKLHKEDVINVLTLAK